MGGTPKGEKEFKFLTKERNHRSERDSGLKSYEVKGEGISKILLI